MMFYESATHFTPACMFPCLKTLRKVYAWVARIWNNYGKRQPTLFFLNSFRLRFRYSISSLGNALGLAKLNIQYSLSLEVISKVV